MTETWHSQRKAWKDRLAALKNIPPVLALLWKSGPGLVAASIFFRLIVALLPLAALAVGRLIINLIVNATRHGVSGQSGTPSPEIWYLLGAEFLIAATGAILGRAIDYCDGRLADHFARETTIRVMNHAATLDLTSFEDPLFYDKLERARVQANDRIGMLNALGRLIQQAITMVSLSVSVMWFSPFLFCLLVLAVVPAFVGESHFAFLGYSLAYSLTPLRRQLDYLRDLGTKKEAAKELKVFGLGPFIRDRFTEINDEVIRRNQRLAGRRLRVGALLAIAGSLGYYGAYAVVVFRTLSGSLSVGDLTFLAGALAGCSAQIQMLFSTFTGIADQALFLSDLIEFFAVKPKIHNAEHPIPAPRRIQDGFDFQNVSFSYPGTNRAVLSNFNFRIHAGERIAVVGENGQGKTTLVKLLARLYDPVAGRILLDGADLRDYDLDDFHNRIGVIFQDFVRYDLSARENVAVGRIDHLTDERRIREALLQSGAEAVTKRLSRGLDQILGRRFEHGVDLSGGEWQKFALARAYMRDAEILILDEPTAALDAMAEYEVFQRFTELTEGKISLLISHRFSTVRMSDRIVVLEGGVIREEGGHEQLMRRGGKYADMFELQAASYR